MYCPLRPNLRSASDSFRLAVHSNTKLLHSAGVTLHSLLLHLILECGTFTSKYQGVQQ